jgi:2-dehydropantoate 2-reductase
MRIAVVGAGGLGGYYGGRLARAGNEVVFIARGDQLQALRTKGLKVESVRDPFRLQEVRATDDPASAGPAELVLVTVKAYDLGRVAESLRPLVDRETAVLPLLNGVDAPARLGAALGAERVLGGLAYVFSFVAEPGLIRQVSPFDRIQFGEMAGGLSERGSRIEGVLRAAGIEAAQVPDIRAALWTKFLFLASSSGLAALTRSPMGPIRSDPDTRALLIGAMREIETLARAQGIALAPGIVEETIRFADGVPADLKPSMLLDLERGRPIEIEALSGAAARIGRELGIPTPIHDFLYAGLKLHRDGKR